MTLIDWYEALVLFLLAFGVSWALHRRQRRRFLQDKGALDIEALRRREVERRKGGYSDSDPAA